MEHIRVLVLHPPLLLLGPRSLPLVYSEPQVYIRGHLKLPNVKLPLKAEVHRPHYLTRTPEIPVKGTKAGPSSHGDGEEVHYSRELPLQACSGEEGLVP